MVTGWASCAHVFLDWGSTSVSAPGLTLEAPGLKPAPPPADAPPPPPPAQCNGSGSRSCRPHGWGPTGPGISAEFQRPREHPELPLPLRTGRGPAGHPRVERVRGRGRRRGRGGKG